MKMNANFQIQILLFSVLLIMMAICQADSCLVGDGQNYLGAWFTFLVQIVMIGLIYLNRKALCPDYKDYNHRFVNYYLKYTYIVTFAGLFVASYYLEYRQLLVGIISLNVPILGWLFYRPDVSLRLLSSWYKYAWIPFFPLFYSKIGFVEMYWQPILILLCLFPLFKFKYVILILLVSALYAFIDVEEQRAPFIKGVVAFVIGIGVGLRRRIPVRLVRIGQVLAYLSVVILFVYIFSDLFVVMTGVEDASQVANNNRNRETIEKDTRSLLYIDVIDSSIKNHYYIWGHTPARGFEVEYSGGLFLNENTVLNKNERYKNEMVLSNVYTWEGLIGLILYSLIYMYGSYLAVYRSKNRIIPFLGCFIAWRWAWGWVEDANNFLCTDIDLWALMAICYSEYFRNLSDEEFKLWARGLLADTNRKHFLKMCSR